MIKKIKRFFVLILVLYLGGCTVPPVKNAQELPNTLSIETDNIEPPVSVEVSEPLLLESSNPQTTSKNMGQCNDVQVEGDLIYFTNHYDNGALYCIKTDGSEKRKINNDRSPMFYVSGDEIYYENDNSTLYAIKTDGSNRRKLSDDKLVSIFWNVVDDQIFYSNWDDSSALYSMKTDGSDRKKISSEDTLYVIVFEDRIYYSGELSSDKGIYSIKTDGSKKIKLSDDRPFRIVAADGWLYYPNTKDGNKLYAIRIDGTDRRKLSDDYALSMYVVNDRIYYTMTGTKIYSISADGVDKQILANLDSEIYNDVTYEISARLSEDMPEYRFLATGMMQGTNMGAIGLCYGSKCL